MNTLDCRTSQICISISVKTYQILRIGRKKAGNIKHAVSPVTLIPLIRIMVNRVQIA